MFLYSQNVLMNFYLCTELEETVLRKHYFLINYFLKLWILSWVFKLLAFVNALLPFEQLNGFSLVWILSWVFKLLDTEHL